jgi:hypothetical protein
VQGLRRDPIERARHFQKCNRGDVQSPPNQDATEPINDRPFFFGRFGLTGGTEREGVSKPVHFV